MIIFPSIMNMAGTSVIKQLPPKDLRTELRLFIAGASKPATGSPLELIRKGFSLLKSLPASKDAVLEYFGTFYEKSVASYIDELENQGKSVVSSGFDQSIIDEIHLSLYNFISTNPFGWRFIIIKWSLSLLGELSMKYAARGRAPVHGSLGDSLQQWMSGKATRSLLDLNIHCLQLIEANETFQPVAYLLDTCVRFSPHFDWVVAHIGSCFPSIVISRVLVAGLKELTTNQRNANSPKIKSVLDILIHLAGCHQVEVENAFKELFMWSLEPEPGGGEAGGAVSGGGTDSDEVCGPPERSATLPYLLTLASRSPVLLSALARAALDLVRPEVVDKLIAFGPSWTGAAGGGGTAGGSSPLLPLLVHLIISLEEAADHIFSLLLKHSSHEDSTVSLVSQEILGILIKELDVLSRVTTSKISFLESLRKCVDDLFVMLLSEKELDKSSALAIVSFIGRSYREVLPECVVFLLLHGSTNDHLHSVVRLSESYPSSQVLAPAIKLALNPKHKANHKNVWNNLIKLSKWEASGTFVSLPLVQSVSANVLLVCEHLCLQTEMSSAGLISELLARTILQEDKQPPPVPVLRALVHAVISYFYLCLLAAEGVEQINGVKVACRMMKKLSGYGGVGRAFALRELLESSIFRVPSILFGAVPQAGSCPLQPHVWLMEENNKQGHLGVLAQKHSRVFHAGVIGTGKRKVRQECPVSREAVGVNTSLLLQLLSAVTQGEGPQPALESVISVALLLVELISPDVMYNGLPWPEEEFCKVTIERDLSIRRTLDNTPLVWALLTFIAHHRPALCYCSVILRAMVATLISEWLSSSQQKQQAGLLTTSCRLVQLMGLGQLLPPPLTALSDVIPHVPSEQVVVLLRECVWNYMRDHVPSPALFSRDAAGVMWRDLASSRPPPQYTETLRQVMINNIAPLGPLYYTLFVQESEEDD